MVSEEDWALCEGPKVAVSRPFETDSVRVYSHLHYLRGIYEMTSSAYSRLTEHSQSPKTSARSSDCKALPSA